MAAIAPRSQTPEPGLRWAAIAAIALGSLALGSCDRGAGSGELRAIAAPVGPVLPPLAELDRPLDPAAAAAARQQGLAARNAGEFAGAIAALATAVVLDPSNLDGWVLLGWTRHRAVLAEELAEELAAGRPPQPGDRQAAIAALEAALARDRDFVPALNALGIVHLFDGNLDRAIAVHERAATLDPTGEVPPYNLALAYHRRQEPDRAIAAAERAAALEPNNPHPWLALAIARADGGEDPAEPLARALALDPRFGDRPFREDDLTRAGFSAPQRDRVSDLLAGDRR